jgi:N-hydroxyarylamine O-acetyltransferase
VVEVTLDGERLLADPGFGMSVLRPIPLQDGAEDDYLGWRHRVRRSDPAVAGPGWELHRLRESGWELMHTTDELPVQPVDVRMGHHYTSTYPTSHFRNGLMLARHGIGRHTTVSTDSVTIRRPGEPTEHRDLRDGEIELLLHELDVPLTPEEEARLLALVPSLRCSG